MRRRVSNLLIIGLILGTLTSCATAIKESKDVEMYQIPEIKNEIVTDFIGFKTDTNILSTSSFDNEVMSEFDQAKAILNTDSLRKLGYNLETYSMANNMADSYFGIYSLQELELYKSTGRYVTFVEVAQSKLEYDENKVAQSIFSGIGSGLLGVGTGALIVGNVWSKNDDPDLSATGESAKLEGGLLLGASIPFLLLSLIPTKTEITFTGLYNIYIYDTETKSLIRKDTVSVKCKDKFSGSYTYDQNSKEIVWDYISKNVYNAIMKKYIEINSWLGYKK